MNRSTALVAGALLVSAAYPALAQDPVATPAAEPAAAAAEPAARDHHIEETIVITGVRKRLDDVLGGVSVLSGTELTAAMRPTIGETLTRQPGVSATSFGPNASRPVLRGLQGERIRVLTDGIGSLDVSNSSADHAVSINPLTAERIEVLRGPAALSFGSSAIGGVVNVIDARIPRRTPESPLHADGLLAFGSAATERAANLVIDVPIVAKLVVHGDANWLKSDDLRSGGHILSQDLRRQAIASGDPDIAALADLKGKIPNSGAKSTDFAAGLAWVDGDLNLGVSVSRLDNLYGVPVRYSLTPGVEAEKVRLDVGQWRYDARAEVPLGGFVDKLRFRAGVADYGHNEIDEEGTIGSRFFSNGAEGRLELVQAKRGGWAGAFGAQYLDKKVHIEGDEKFLPPNRTRQAGLFALESIDFGRVRAEAGGRVEFSRQTAEADIDVGNPDLSRRFTTVSGSLGATYLVGGDIRAGLNVSHSERAPSADELFASGPHAGTQAFEYGDPGFNTEKSLSVEASLKRSRGPLSFAVAAYHSRFADYIYLAPTGAVQDELPVYQYLQGRARYTGFEAQADADIGRIGGVDWTLGAVADGVRATVKGYGPAPQIPPLRLLGSVGGKVGKVNGELEVEHSFAQGRTAPNETETDGFTLVNASLNWRPLDSRPDLHLTLAANNLFDVVARRHASLLKDYAPLAGRDIRVTARIGF